MRASTPRLWQAGVGKFARADGEREGERHLRGSWSCRTVVPMRESVCARAVCARACAGVRRNVAGRVTALQARSVAFQSLFALPSSPSLPLLRLWISFPSSCRRRLPPVVEARRALLLAPVADTSICVPPHISSSARCGDNNTCTATVRADHQFSHPPSATPTASTTNRYHRRRRYSAPPLSSIAKAPPALSVRKNDAAAVVSPPLNPSRPLSPLFASPTVSVHV